MKDNMKADDLLEALGIKNKVPSGDKIYQEMYRCRKRGAEELTFRDLWAICRTTGISARRIWSWFNDASIRKSLVGAKKIRKDNLWLFNTADIGSIAKSYVIDIVETTKPIKQLEGINPEIVRASMDAMDNAINNHSWECHRNYKGKEDG